MRRSRILLKASEYVGGAGVQRPLGKGRLLAQLPPVPEACASSVLDAARSTAVPGE